MKQMYLDDTSSLDNAVAYIIHHTSRILRFHLAKFFQNQGVDISPEQWFILFRLYERPGQSQGELADRDLHDHPNITRLLDALERRKLVYRAADPGDRRRSLVSLTEEGQQTMERLLPLVVEERKRLFAGLTPEEIAAFVSTLRRIEANLVSE